jgi:cytochrome P450
MGEPDQTHTGQSPQDPRSTYDAMRARCAVVREDNHWVVLRHAEVLAAASDADVFSSRVTARRAIPNSLDGTEHAAYRTVIDRYLTDDRVSREESQCRAHAAAIVDDLPRGVTVRTIADIGTPFAVRSQSTWLGWPSHLEEELVGWIQDNHTASRSGSRDQMRNVAERFDQMVRELVEARRHKPRTDLTGELLDDQVDGRPLSTEEIVSILRNWTAGDLGSLATSVGVLVDFMAMRPTFQEELRELVDAHDSAGLVDAIEEVLRIDDPFVTTRRVTTRATTLGGVDIAEGEQVLLNWTAANRDPLVFHDPDRYDPAANSASNLVFGAGPHVCPGRALTLMELRVILEELLRRTTWIELAQDRTAVRESPPVGGWASVPVVLR